MYKEKDDDGGGVVDAETKKMTFDTIYHFVIAVAYGLPRLILKYPFIQSVFIHF